MIYRLKSLFVPAMLVVGLAACGGGGGSLSVEDALHDSVDIVCERAFECMSTYPDTDFEQLYGTDVQACKDNYNQFVDAAIEQYNMSIDAGRLDFDGSAASDCLDAQEGFSCEEYWTAPDPDSCGEVFVGTVETGGECTQSYECAADADSCDSVAGTCGPG